MIRKSGYRFSEKIMLKKKIEWDDVSKKSHPALARVTGTDVFPGIIPRRFLVSEITRQAIRLLSPSTYFATIHSEMRSDEDRITIRALSSGRDEGRMQLNNGKRCHPRP